MKNIETEIKSKFISLLETRRIDEIDVRLLSNELKITRQTFYYHYKNIYDLIYSIILDEQVEPKENETLEEISNNILDAFFKKEELFKEILDSSAKDILEEMTYSYFYRSFNLYLKSDPRLNLDSRKDVSSFVSYGISNYLLTYFKYDNYMKEDIKEKLKCFLNERSIKSIVEGYLNNI